MKLYERMTGALISSLTECTDRAMAFPLNGIDQLTFSMFLDDPEAVNVDPINTVVKVWRYVDDPLNSKTFTPAAGEPTFAGVVGFTEKSTNDNKMKVQVFSPFWHLKFRFHLLNHRLVRNNLLQFGSSSNHADFGDLWDQSALMWKIIDLTQGAFAPQPPPHPGASGNSFIGIVMGSWTNTISVSPYYIAQGSNSWSNIADDLLQRPGGNVDLAPTYIHIDDDRSLMYFNTENPLGTNKTGSLSLDYGVANANLDQISETIQAQPDSFANYLWVVGQGDENSNKIGVGTGMGPFSATNVGVYMGLLSRQELKTTAACQDLADTYTLLAQQPAKGYTVSLSPAAPPYFATDYVLGDLVTLNADRGALQVSGAQQRIVQIGLAISDNNMEISTVLLTGDVKGRFV
jgi:hypothetical protein